MMSFAERFYGLKLGKVHYAPATLGSPQYTTQTDYSVFRKTKEEKNKTKEIKQAHRMALIATYGPGTKKLNVEGTSLTS